MYSSLSSATHHILFPPRLKVVVEQQNPDGLSSHSRNQAPLYGFLGHQSYRPPGAPFRRAATDHGDDTLPLAVLQHRGGSGPALLIECAFETALLIAMTHLPNRLLSQGNHL